MTATVREIEALRDCELSRVLSLHSSAFIGRDLLEIGSGTGAQLLQLANVCRSVRGVELENGLYSRFAHIPIDSYSGALLPYDDKSFDVIFTSNVLEHLTDEGTSYREMSRVLRPGGVAVHVVPTHTWRLWTTLIHYPEVVLRQFRRISPETHAGVFSHGDAGERRPLMARIRACALPERHGEQGSMLSEHSLFSPKGWRNRLDRNGWKVLRIDPVGIYYSGHLVTDLSIQARTRLARMLGSSTMVMLSVPA